MRHGIDIKTRNFGKFLTTRITRKTNIYTVGLGVLTHQDGFYSSVRMFKEGEPSFSSYTTLTSCLVELLDPEFPVVNTIWSLTSERAILRNGDMHIVLPGLYKFSMSKTRVMLSPSSFRDPKDYYDRLDSLHCFPSIIPMVTL